MGSPLGSPGGSFSLLGPSNQSPPVTFGLAAASAAALMANPLMARGLSGLPPGLFSNPGAFPLKPGPGGMLPTQVMMPSPLLMPRVSAPGGTLNPNPHAHPHSQLFPGAPFSLNPLGPRLPLPLHAAAATYSAPPLQPQPQAQQFSSGAGTPSPPSVGVGLGLGMHEPQPQPQQQQQQLHYHALSPVGNSVTIPAPSPENGISIPLPADMPLDLPSQHDAAQLAMRANSDAASVSASSSYEPSPLKVEPGAGTNGAGAGSPARRALSVSARSPDGGAGDSNGGGVELTPLYTGPIHFPEPARGGSQPLEPLVPSPLDPQCLPPGNALLGPGPCSIRCIPYPSNAQGVHVWCRVSYYELDKHIGKDFEVCRRRARAICSTPTLLVIGLLELQILYTYRLQSTERLRLCKRTPSSFSCSCRSHSLSLFFRILLAH